MLNSLPVPHLNWLASPNLLLQLENAVEEGLSCGRAAGDVDVHWDYPVTAPHHCIRVVVVAAAVGTTPHGDDPSGLWHLIVHLGRRRRRKRGKRRLGGGMKRRGRRGQRKEEEGKGKDKKSFLTEVLCSI